MIADVAPQLFAGPLLWSLPHIKKDGSRNHVRCSLRLGGELLCAAKQLRHYHSPEELSWDNRRPSDSEVERIDVDIPANPANDCR